MKKALFIVGPTASGKTALAVKIAGQYPSVLISADSIQVFKNASIISGKDQPENVKIKLIDVVLPSQNFSISDFQKSASQEIRKALANKRIPIIVGGTGWYADSLYRKIDTINIPPNEKLRKKLEKLDISDLQKKLKEINPARFEHMNSSDSKNKRRLIRAIEIGLSKDNISSEPEFDIEEILILGLTTSMTNLRELITKRVQERIKAGALEEARGLFRIYDEISPQIKTANGYRQIFGYLSGDMSWEEAVERWVIVEYQHAKKQLTWFAKTPNIHWFDIKKKDSNKALMRLIEQNFNSKDLFK